MEVVAGGPAGGAHIAHHIPLLHGLALLAADAAHMGVEGAGAVAVGDDHIVAIRPTAAGALGCVNDHGKEIVFANGSTEMGPIISKLRETLTGIQMGTIDGPEGWIVEIK